MVEGDKLFTPAYSLSFRKVTYLIIKLLSFNILKFLYLLS